MRYFILILLLLSAPVEAAIKQKTNYRYFKVSGNSAAQIHKSLLAHAKGPAGHDAYATTNADIRQRGKYIQGRTCRTSEVLSIANFQIVLPRLESSKANQNVMSNWRNFSAFLKTHEEHHRALWLACTANFNQMAASLEAKSCGPLKTKYLSLWRAMLQNCKLQNANFDINERANLMRQPFINLVRQGQ